VGMRQHIGLAERDSTLTPDPQREHSVGRRRDEVAYESVIHIRSL
jgi:hypothetical protein